jgi:CDGSH-type Zn-finger protein
LHNSDLLEHLMADVVIIVRDNGPYRITGPITLRDAEGNEFALPEGTIALCRCGHSSRKPFCDATHRTCGFESAPRAGRDPGSA